MRKANRPRALKIVDLPLGIGLFLTGAYYLIISQEAFHDTLLHRYTTEHLVEYVVVAFFLWGVADVVFHVLGFPRELMALRHEWLAPRRGREPVSRAAAYSARLEREPRRLRESRIGQRYVQAIAYLDEKGSADGLADHLRYLADQDYEKTQTNYALLRFICWVTPMFGFLGTVVHFGTALSGHAAGELADHLPVVMAEMGTAFNTTTVALTAATTMMFSVFLCERAERAIVQAIDERVDRELLNRFEVSDANLTPFLHALRDSTQISVDAVNACIAGQLQLWSDAMQTERQEWEKQREFQSRAWVDAIERLEGRFEANDQAREQRLSRALQAFETQRQENLKELAPTIEQVSDLKAELARFVGRLGDLVDDRRELVELQSTLADNLCLLRETRQIDQALHGLTAAIHLLTARGQSPPEARAA